MQIGNQKNVSKTTDSTHNHISLAKNKDYWKQENTTYWFLRLVRNILKCMLV